MVDRTILTALLLATLGIVPPASAAIREDDGGAITAETTDSFSELSADYESAITLWKRDVRAAEDAKTRRALRKANPVHEFVPRFEELAGGGDGRALLWLVDHADDLGGTSTARAERRLAFYERFLAEHVPGPLVPELCTRLFQDRQLPRRLGVEVVDGLGQRIHDAAEDPHQRITIRYGLARLLAGSSDEARAERGAMLLSELLAIHPDVSEAKAARELLFELRHLRVGCVAPDFTGTTVDGEEVHLADYRGRVVVLDFFGFW